MPVLGRYNNTATRRRCIEDETPIVPKERKKTKKRKLDQEFAKDAKDDAPQSDALCSENHRIPVLDHDENAAPDSRNSSSTLPAVQSRRKAPRSQVRKVLRTNLQPEGKVKAERDETEVIKSQTSSTETSQKCESVDRQNTVEEINDTTSSCRVLTSPSRETMSIRTVRVDSAVKEGNETTVIEEDYQRKYFQLLNTMNDLQDKFLYSQRNFEELVQAREAFIEELKGNLENKHQELGSTQQELERSNNKIAELEERRQKFEEKIQHLSEKVEDIKRKESEVKHQILTDSEDELQRTIKKQREILEFYKLLTSVSVERVVEENDNDSLAVIEKFRCSIKTAQTKEFKFLLSYDCEFAEVEYTPVDLDSQSIDSSFPEYLKEQIFFESDQAPNFLRRLIQMIQKPGSDN